MRASAEPGSRLVGLVFRLSDELDMHEEDAREFVLAAADPALLPSEPYFFPAGLQHFLRAKRLALFQRHALLATIEELLLLRQVDADVLELTERLLVSRRGAPVVCCGDSCMSRGLQGDAISMCACVRALGIGCTAALPVPLSRLACS